MEGYSARRRRTCLSCHLVPRYRRDRASTLISPCLPEHVVKRADAIYSPSGQQLWIRGRMATRSPSGRPGETPLTKTRISCASLPGSRRYIPSSCPGRERLQPWRSRRRRLSRTRCQQRRLAGMKAWVTQLSRALAGSMRAKVEDVQHPQSWRRLLPARQCTKRHRSDKSRRVLVGVRTCSRDDGTTTLRSTRFSSSYRFLSMGLLGDDGEVAQ